MEISHRATQALITGAIGIVAVFAVRFSLDFAYNRYENRLAAARSDGRRTPTHDLQLLAGG